MMPIDFEGSNITLSKPESMSDEQCMPLKAFVGLDNDGFQFFLTAWVPNKEDLEALNAGRPVMLKILGTGFPPVAVYTYDENYECNNPG